MCGVVLKVEAAWHSLICRLSGIEAVHAGCSIPYLQAEAPC